MKKILLIVILTSALAACTKDKKRCYECESGAPDPKYIDVGCFTKDEWDRYQPVDGFGNYINKDHCRKK